MFRIAIVRAISRRAFSSAATGGVARASVVPAISWPSLKSLSQERQANFRSVRNYSAPASLSQREVEGRILDLLKGFDKVTDESRLTPTAHFVNDLGLDSLDTVEVVMAIEEEFGLEIPDKEADAILSVDHAVKYILSQPDAH